MTEDESSFDKVKKGIKETAEGVKEGVEDAAHGVKDTAKEVVEPDTYSGSEEERQKRDYNEAGRQGANESGRYSITRTHRCKER